MELFKNKIMSTENKPSSSEKKILLVTRPIAPPWDEGSKNFAYFLAKNISRFIIGLLTEDVLLNLPSNILQKPIYSASHFSFWQKIKLIFHLRKLKKEFQILHFLFTPTKENSCLIKSLLGQKQNNFRTIQTIATLREDLYSNKELQKMLFADLIITYSDYSKNKLEKLGFNNVQRIYPGIDLNLYRNKGKNPTYLKKYGFSSDDFIINFSGEYIRNGAMNMVVESFIEISKIIPNARLSLAVRIKNQPDAEKKKEVIETFRQNNLLSKVAFHDDAQYEVFELYNMADVSIFPVEDMHGKFDVPLAVIEAMACEKPVILSDLPILQEFAKDNNSVKIEAGNLQKLNAAILDLYQNSIKREQIGKMARQFTEENFDIRKVAQKYAEIYEKL